MAARGRRVNTPAPAPCGGGGAEVALDAGSRGCLAGLVPSWPSGHLVDDAPLLVLSLRSCWLTLGFPGFTPQINYSPQILVSGLLLGKLGHYLLLF